MHSNIVSGGKRLRSVSPPPPADATSFLRSVRMRRAEPTAPRSEATPINDYVVQALQQFLAQEPASPPAQALSPLPSLDTSLDNHIKAPEQLTAPMEALPIPAQNALLEAQAKAVDEFLNAELAATGQINLQKALQPLCEYLKASIIPNYVENMTAGETYTEYGEYSAKKQIGENITGVIKRIEEWEKNPTEHSTLLKDNLPKPARPTGTVPMPTREQMIDIIAKALVKRLRRSILVPDPRDPSSKISIIELNKRGCLVKDPKNRKRLITTDDIRCGK